MAQNSLALMMNYWPGGKNSFADQWLNISTRQKRKRKKKHWFFVTLTHSVPFFVTNFVNIWSQIKSRLKNKGSFVKTVGYLSGFLLELQNYHYVDKGF